MHDIYQIREKNTVSDFIERLTVLPRKEFGELSRHLKKDAADA